jgi:replicative DNA helicase
MNDGTLGGRVPPYDQTAEAAVLGAILLHNGALPKVQGAIGAEHFYVERNRRIFEAMVQLGATGAAIDHVTLGNWLKERGDLEKIGGAMALADLTDAVATVSNVGHYAQIVARLAARRRVIYAAQEVAASGYGGGEERFDAWLAEVRATMAKALAGTGDDGSAPRRIDDDLKEAFADITERRTPEGLIPTGLTTIDLMTGGLWPGLLTTIAGRPGMGKSAIGLNIAINAAIAGKKVLFLTLEDTRKFAVLRLLARFADVDLLRLVHRTVPEGEFSKLLEGICKLDGLPFWLDDTSGLSSMQIRSKVMAHAVEHGCDLLVVDHLLEVQEDGAENETQAVSRAARNIRDLIKEMHIPGVLLTQLNRGVENRQDKRPTLADLKQSGKVEEVSRVVVMLYRQGYYDDNDNPLVEAIVAKANHGRTGTAYLWGDMSRMFLRGWDRQGDGDPRAPYADAGEADGFTTAAEAVSQGWMSERENNGGY